MMQDSIHVAKVHAEADALRLCGTRYCVTSLGCISSPERINHWIGPHAALLTRQRQSPAHLAFHSFQLFRTADANFIFVCFQAMRQPSAARANSMAEPFSVGLAISELL